MRRIIVIMSLIGLGIGLYKHYHQPRPVSAKLVTIQSRNLEFKVATTAKTIGEVVEEQEIHNAPFTPSYLKRGEGELLTHGMTIELRHPLNITLTDGGNQRQVTTTAVTVNDLLYEQKLGLAATDRVTPALGSFLAAGMLVNIDRIVDLEVTESAEIAYDIKLEHDPDTYYGREEVISPGIAGKKEQQFLITYKNGVEVKRKLLKAKVLAKPVTEIRKFGTKIEMEERREGRASWYATKRCMPAFAKASAGKCAAHPFYDIGRYAIVTRLDTGKTIIVRINDRGPELDKHPDRVIDLDSVAYKELAGLTSGTIPVRVELLKN